MDDLLSGLVDSVTSVPVGTQTIADAAVGATVLLLEDAGDMSPTGGQVAQIADDGTTVAVLDYVESDDDESTITLAAPLTTALPTDTVLRVYPERRNVTALVLVNGTSEPIPANVPWDKQDALPVGPRDASAREEVTLAQDGQWSWAVYDLPNQPLTRDGSYLDPTSLGSGQTFSPDAPTATDGYAEDHAWWQVVDGEVKGFWRLTAGAWVPSDIVSADALVAKNALIDALSVSDLSVVDLGAVNISGGSIAVAVSDSGDHPEPFAGTALSAGWTSTVTGPYGTGSPVGAASAAVIATGRPTGADGSVLRIDYGPSGQTSSTLSAAGAIDTGIVASDALISARIRAAVNPPASFGGDQSLRFMFRAAGTTWDTTTADGVFLDFDTTAPAIKSLVNGATSTLSQLPAQTDFSTAWYQVRFQILAGQVKAKVWREGTTEPAWTTVQQAGNLQPGPVRIDWRVNPFLATSTGQKWYVDNFDVTTYGTGFKVNPDGTGAWPNLETRIGRDIADVDARMQTGTFDSGAFTAVDTVNTINVTFPNAYTSTPQVMLTPFTGFSPVNLYPPTVTAKSTTGFTAAVARRVGTGAVGVSWVAIGP